MFAIRSMMQNMALLELGVNDFSAHNVQDFSRFSRLQLVVKDELGQSDSVFKLGKVARMKCILFSLY